RAVLQPHEFADDYAQHQADSYLEPGGGDAWEYLTLREIFGRGSQIASGVWDGQVAGTRRAGPVTWVELRIDEHLDAAFEALTAVREIPPGRRPWESVFSLYSCDPVDSSKLDNREAQAESAVYVLANP